MHLEQPDQQRRDTNRLVRRSAIINIARDAFLTDGYTATTMSTIANRIGGSKTTLWSYFPSKEELFLAVVEKMAIDITRPVRDMLQPDMSIHATLVSFGEKILVHLLSPAAIKLQRMVISESERLPKIGQILYDRGPREVLAMLAKYFQGLMEAGRLREGSAELAARQIMDLLLSPQRSLLWNAHLPFGSAERRMHVEITVDVFLRAYARPV